MDDPIILTGAFERDNFGDLLYAHLVGAALEPLGRVQLASYFPSSVDSLLPTPVADLQGFLARASARAVVLGGGAALPLRMEDAAHMVGYAANEWETVIGDPRVVLPYLPELSLYPLNLGTPEFVMSVGVGGSDRLPVSTRRRLWSTLLAAESVTCRVPDEAVELERLSSVRAKVAPDVIHALGPRLPRSSPVGGSTVVQLSELDLRNHQRDLVQALAHVAFPSERVVFVAAGTAPGHDDLVRLEMIASELSGLRPEVEWSVDSRRHPLEIAERIASAQLFIGSSLHARICGSVGSVPRVSLQRAKVDAYAKAWDRHMPFAVLPTEVPRAVEMALTGRVRAVADRESAARAQEAHSALDGLVAAVRAAGTTPQDRQARALRRHTAVEAGLSARSRVEDLVESGRRWAVVKYKTVVREGRARLNRWRGAGRR